MWGFTTHRVIAAALLLAGTELGRAQIPADSVNRMHYGVFLDYNEDIHQANFQKLPGIPNCCPQFRSGAGSGFAGGASVRFPIAGRVSLDLRAGYSSMPATLTAVEPTTVIINGAATPGAFTHTLTGSIANLGIEPLAAIRLISALSMHAGFRVGTVVAKSYSQKEEITEPAGVGTFSDSNGQDLHTRLRNVSSGAIPNASSLYAALVAGVQYRLPLNANGTWFASPEIDFTYGLTQIVSALSWRASAVSAGVVVKYAPVPAPPEQRILREQFDTVRIAVKNERTDRFKAGGTFVRHLRVFGSDTTRITDTYVRTDTLFVASPPALAASLSMVGLERAGDEVNRPKIRVEEFFSIRQRPLLMYVFYDKSTPEIPDRYTRLTPDRTDAFRVELLHNVGTIETYHHLLNIVGRRMREHPAEHVRLVGCNAGSDMESGGSELSRQRAEAVKRYLTEVWKIASDRLAVETRDLPERPSTPIDDSDKAAENRRVEIVTDAWPIVEPVTTNDTVRVSNPPGIRCAPVVSSEAGVASWRLAIMQRGDTLRVFHGQSQPPSRIDWWLTDEQQSMPIYDVPMSATLDVTDSAGGRAAASASVQIEQITISKKRIERREDKEIDRFSLILFDFDKSDVAGRNLRIVKDIMGRMKPASTLTITGYTDRTGAADYNRHLSESRATAAARALGVPRAAASGKGSDTLLYDNTLPEGRFYCRTVEIVAETNVTE